MSALSPIPTRSNGQIPQASWWNLLKDRIDALTSANAVDASAYGFDSGASASTNDAAVLEAIEALNGGPGAVSLPRGTFDVGTILLDSLENVDLIGNGTVLRSAASPTNPLIELFDCQNCMVRGITFTVGSGTPTSRAYGVWIHGDSRFCTVQDCVSLGMVSAVQTGYGATGASDGLVEDTVLVHVRSMDSPNSFGFTFDDADRITAMFCHSEGHWLDGWKARDNVNRLSLQNCNGINNGVGGSGDGLDAYSGGSTTRVDGGDWSHNSGAGIVIKTDDDTGVGSSLVHKGHIRGITCVGNIAGIQVYSYYSSAGSSVLAYLIPGTPQIALFTIADNYVEASTANHGILINGFGIVVSNNIVVNCPLSGIWVGHRSLACHLRDNIVLGCGTAGTVNDEYGINVRDGAYDIQISGGTVWGIWDEGLYVLTAAQASANGLTSDKAWESLTPTHQTNIYVHAEAEEIFIRDVDERYCLDTAGIQTWGGSWAWTLTPSGTISGGTYTITFSGQTTSALAWDASNATIQAALEALSNIAPGDVVLDQGPLPNFPLRIKLRGVYLNIGTTTLTVNGASLTGSSPLITPAQAMLGRVQVVDYLPQSGAASGNYGGIGSTWRRSDTLGPTYQRQRKVHGSPSAPTVGWAYETACLIGSKSHNFGSIAAAGYESTTVTVSGAALGDIVLGVTLASTLSDLVVSGKVTATDTVTVTAFNPTGSAIDPANSTLTVAVMEMT